VNRACSICLLLIALAFSGCVSRHHVVDDYVKVIGDEGLKARRPTMILFLIDGLSVPLTQEFIDSGAWPEFRSFFMGQANSFRVGRAVFPSLTHSNISSILTSRNLDGHAITGNQVRLDGLTVNFEIPAYRHELDRLIRKQSVFTDLSQQGRRSLSLAPYYGDQASARYPLDVEMGLAYKRGDFEYVDGKLLASLENLLDATPSSAWPEFIFVHLMGIDSASHRFGRRSPQVFEHARFLNTRLTPIFARLQRAVASGHPVGALLTSDHGMADVKQVLDIEDQVNAAAPDAFHINQGRLYTVSLRKDPSERERANMQADLSRIGGVEAVVSRRGEVLHARVAGRDFQIRYQKANCGHEGDYALSVEGRPFLCPSQVDKLTRNLLYPYFVTSMATFFRVYQKPDFLILAAPGISFNGSPTGNHGGLHPDELLVPVLSWRMQLRSSEPVLRTYHLLEFLRRAR
jgi:hypothetical protein